MKYCTYCGMILEANDVFCKRCGKRCDFAVANVQDTGSAGWGVLGFFFPLVGLILYLVWRQTQPKNAQSAGKGALINVIISAVFVLIYILIFAGIIGSLLFGIFSSSGIAI